MPRADVPSVGTGRGDISGPDRSRHVVQQHHGVLLPVVLSARALASPVGLPDSRPSPHKISRGETAPLSQEVESAKDTGVDSKLQAMRCHNSEVQGMGMPPSLGGTNRR